MRPLAWMNGAESRGWPANRETHLRAMLKPACNTVNFNSTGTRPELKILSVQTLRELQLCQVRCNPHAGRVLQIGGCLFGQRLSRWFASRPSASFLWYATG